MKNYMKVTFLSKNENVIFSRTVAVGFLVNLNLESKDFNFTNISLNVILKNKINPNNDKTTKTILVPVIPNKLDNAMALTAPIIPPPISIVVVPDVNNAVVLLIELILSI